MECKKQNPDTFVFLLATMAAICLSGSVSRGTDFKTLLNRIPDTANAVVALDVEALFASDLGKKEKWKESYSDSYAASPVLVPPNSKRFLLASEMDIEAMKPLWEIAATELSIDPSIEEIAKRWGGATDSFSGVDAVWTSHQHCVVKFAPYEFGLMFPANRSNAARWVHRASQQGAVNFSPYLTTAVGYAEDAGPEIIMAIDLANIIRPEQIRKSVEKAPMLRELNRERVSNVLSSMRGVMLGVRVTDHIYGKLLVDFDVDASELKGVAKSLILQVLSNVGATLDEAQDWQATVQGKRMVLAGKMSPEGMRRLFSLVSLDTSMVNSEPSMSANKEPSQQDVALATKRYFHSVSKYLSDLQKARNNRTLAQVTLWAHNFSRKILRLPSRNIDPDMLAYGQSVAYGLQDAVAYIQGIGEGTAQRTSQIVPNSSVRVGALPTFNAANVGGIVVRQYMPFAVAQVDIASALQERNQIAAEEYEKGIAAAEDIVDQIQAATVEIKTAMEQRYGITF